LSEEFFRKAIGGFQLKEFKKCFTESLDMNMKTRK
jgi:hypothetical protein